MKAVPVSLTLSPYAYACLKAIAKEQDRSMSYMASVAIEKYAEGDDIPGSGLDSMVLKEIKAEYGIENARR